MSTKRMLPLSTQLVSQSGLLLERVHHLAPPPTQAFQDLKVSAISMNRLVCFIQQASRPLVQETWSAKGFVSSYSALRANTKISSNSARITASAKEGSLTLVFPLCLIRTHFMEVMESDGARMRPASLPYLQERGWKTPPLHFTGLSVSE